MADMTPLADILNGTAADATDVQSNFQTLETYINGVNLFRTDGTEVMTADLNLDGNKVVNLAAPTAANDATRKVYVDDAVAASALIAAPIGMMAPFGGTAAPSEWLLCNGDPVDRTTYAALFAVVGEAFGDGNGVTTFNLPNMQDRYPIGDSGTLTLGDTVGSNDAVAVAHDHTFVHDHPDTLAAPAHNHNMPNAAIESFGNTGLANRFVTATSWPGFAGNGETGAASATALTGSVSNNPGTDVTAGQNPTSSGTNTNRPESVVVNWIIRAGV